MYKNQSVPQKMVNQMLEAGMYAPSARNYRSWQFVVIDDRKQREDISNLHPYAKMMKQATLAIVVCGDQSIEPEIGYNVINCSAATQNILLAAHDLDLGSVWLGLYPRGPRINDLVKYLNLPDHIIPISLICIGWPDEAKPVPRRVEKEMCITLGGENRKPTTKRWQGCVR